MSEVNIIQCSNCGSTVINVQGRVGQCEHCGSTIELPRRKSANTRIGNVDAAIAKETNIVVVKNNVDKDTFWRKSLIALALSPDSPADIFDSAFGSVHLENRHYGVVKCKSIVYYSADVGYRRTGTRWETERYYDHSSKKYETRRVSKEYYYTDWDYYRGTYTHDRKQVISLDGVNVDTKSILTAIERIPHSDVRPPKAEETKSIPMPTKADLDIAIAKNEKEASRHYLFNIPGDSHRNEHIERIDSQRGVINNYVLPTYFMEFNHGEGAGMLECVANDYKSIKVSGVKDETKEKAVAESKKQGRKSTKVISILTLLSALLLFVAFVATLMLNGARVPLTIFLPWTIITVLFGVIWIILAVRAGKRTRQLERTIIDKHRKMKIDSLHTYFSNNFVARPSEEEIAEMMTVIGK